MDNNGKTGIKIICCDIDGTLVTDSKELPEENVLWIRRAVEEKRVRFVLVSGRMLSGIRHFYREMGISGPVSAYNGCALYDENDRLVLDHRMPRDVTTLVLETARSMGMDLILFDDKVWHMENLDCYTFRKKKSLYQSECVPAVLADINRTKLTNKIISMSEDKARLEAFEAELRKRGLDNSRVTYYPGPDFLEIMPVGITKADAVTDLSKWYGIPVSEIMAVGDDYNDVDMIKASGLGVAMANAVPEAKEAADWITLSNNEAGVAAAIRKFIFNIE